MIDASIYNNLQTYKPENPLNQLASVLQIKNAMQANELGGIQLNTARQGAEDANKLRALLSGNVDLSTPEGQRQAIAASPTEGTNLIKTMAEMRAKQVEEQSKRIDLATKKTSVYRDALSGVNDQTSAAQWLASQYQDPDISFLHRVPLQQALQNIPTDPAEFEQWKQKQALGMTKFMELNAPKTTTVDTGSGVQVLQTPGLGGAPKVVSTMPKSVSPDTAAKLSQERNLAAQGVTYQTDANNNLVALPTKLPAGATAVGSQVLGPDNKPIQSNKGAPTEFQGKSATFGARAEAADKILTDLTGKYSPAAVGVKQGLGNIWGIGGALEAGGNVVMSKEGQQAEQAMRDFVNAVLRQESGAAISQSEFDNAKRQYFPQPGDSEKVIAQKARNRQIAIEGFKRNAGRAAWSADSLPGGQPVQLPGGFTFMGVE